MGWNVSLSLFRGRSSRETTRAFFAPVAGGLVGEDFEGTFSAGPSFVSSSTCSAGGDVSSVLSAAAPELETGCGESMSSREKALASSWCPLVFSGMSTSGMETVLRYERGGSSSGTKTSKTKSGGYCYILLSKFKSVTKWCCLIVTALQMVSETTLGAFLFGRQCNFSRSG